MSGALQAVFQNQRSFGPAPGQQAYTTAGTYSWVAPAGVTSVSVVAVGGGSTGVSEGSGGAGGGLGYKNNITVTPGSSYTVVVGNTSVTTEYYANGSSISGFNGTGEYRIYVNTSLGNTYYNAGTSSGSVSGVDNFTGIQALILANTGRLVKTGLQQSNTGTVQFYSILTSSGDSYFSTRATVGGSGGYSSASYGYGGTYAGDGGGNGGGSYGGAAGGAGGYSGNGGDGIAAGNGGGGGGGSYSGLTGQGAGGGGVGILGQGSSGAAGTPSNSTSYNQTMNGGGGGSGGANGSNTTNTDSSYSARDGGAGGAYGGGGGSSFNGTNGVGASGAVRIIWPGNTRSFPSTNTGNL